MDKNDLLTFEKNGSDLLGHPVRNMKKGIEFSTGSHGMGLSLGIGVALSLKKKKIKPGDTVSIMAPNTSAMYEAHFAIPMIGAVINTINIRLDAKTISYILEHSDSKLIFVDTEFIPIVKKALKISSSWQNCKKYSILKKGWKI